MSYNKAETNKEEMKDVFKKKIENSYQLKILGGQGGGKKIKIQETGREKKNRNESFKMSQQNAKQKEILKSKRAAKKIQKQNVDTEGKAKFVYKCVRSLRATVRKLQTFFCIFWMMVKVCPRRNFYLLQQESFCPTAQSMKINWLIIALHQIKLWRTMWPRGLEMRCGAFHLQVTATIIVQVNDD